ncbi:MAG TPA: hypothetical protein VFI96_00270, partial [Longimicrobiaceae bacterium]|nr:hypothetical protein [Longimicrobiaceae bacterium]
MSRPSRFSFRLQNLVLLVLIPGLLLATLLIGGAIYRSVYGIIMTGFDQKLFAVSTVTGAFIRGEDHDALFRPHQIRALAADPASREILGADPAARQLFRIDPANGGALAVDSLPANTSALALDAAGKRLWVATAHPAAL